MENEAMSWEAQRTRVAGRIWQSITQSGVDVSAVPREQIEMLVNTITEGVLVEMNDLLEQVPLPPEVEAARVMAPAEPAAAGPAAGSQGAPGAEVVLWEGRPFLSLVERYVITNQRVRIINGLIGKSHEDIEMIRVKDVDHTQGVGERMLNIGDVFLRSGDASRPSAVLRNVPDPEQVHEIVRRAMLESRKQYPFHFQQEM